MTQTQQCFITGLLLFCVATPAFAEPAGTVYKCRNSSGRLSFGDQPCPQQYVPHTTEAHRVWHLLKDNIKPVKRISMDVGSSVESLSRCKSRAEEFQPQLEKIQARAAQLGREFGDIKAASSLLGQCLQCKTSAYRYCDQANEHLDIAANALVR